MEGAERKGSCSTAESACTSASVHVCVRCCSVKVRGVRLLRNKVKNQFSSPSSVSLREFLQRFCTTWLWAELWLFGTLLLGRHWKRSERKESSTAGSASIRSPSSMSRASGSILRESSREKGSISKPGT